MNDQQKLYKDKASYLIERGYVQGKTVEELDIEIYKKVVENMKVWLEWQK
jgi:UDP-N-acetylenolpyruvoylglucosamine reductase